MNEVKEHTALQTFECPECGGPLVMSTEIRAEDMGHDENGKLHIAIRMVSMEIVGGCEHAETIRDEVIFEQAEDDA